MQTRRMIAAGTVLAIVVMGLAVFFNQNLTRMTGQLADLIHFSVSGQNALHAENPLKVGAILPLTGEFSFLGMQMQRGMEIALEDFPEATIEIVFEDDKTFNATASINALQKLINLDNVDVVLNPAVNTMKALAPVLNQNEIPAVVFWDSNKELEGLGTYVFGMGVSTERAGTDMAEFAYVDLGIRKVYIISALDEWSAIISSSFASRFEFMGGDVVGHERVPADHVDFRTTIAKVRQSGAEAVYFPLFPEANESLVRKAKEQGFTGALLSGDGFIDSTITNLGTFAEGVYATQPWLPDEFFLSKYEVKYGEALDLVNLSFAGLAYDSVKLLAELAGRLKANDIPVSSENITKALGGYAFEGVTGSGVFSSGHILEKREKILLVHNGAFELVR